MCSITFIYLNLCIPSSQQCNAQQNAFLKYTVILSADDEVDDQLGRSHVVQRTLDVCYASAWLIRVLPRRATYTHRNTLLSQDVYGERTVFLLMVIFVPDLQRKNCSHRCNPGLWCGVAGCQSSV